MARQLSLIITMWLVWLTTGALSQAQVLREKPDVAKEIRVDQKIGETVPLAAKFHDDQNNYVALGDLFDGERPVVISFNFSNCPRLCIVQFNNLVAALIPLDLLPGRDFQIVSISLDPRDKPSNASETKLKYLASYGKMDTKNGWHFLVGNQATIEQVADACGIRYEYIPEQDSFSHPSAFIFCSPQGQIIRYLNGLEGNLASTLRPAIVEAGEGRVGGVIDRMMYFASCYEYDPTSGKYTLVARKIMRWAATLTIVGLLIGLVPFWFGRRRALRSTSGPENDLNEFPTGTAPSPSEVHP